MLVTNQEPKDTASETYDEPKTFSFDFGDDDADRDYLDFDRRRLSGLGRRTGVQVALAVMAVVMVAAVAVLVRPTADDTSTSVDPEPAGAETAKTVAADPLATANSSEATPSNTTPASEGLNLPRPGEASTDAGGGPSGANPALPAPAAGDTVAGDAADETAAGDKTSGDNVGGDKTAGDKTAGGDKAAGGTAAKASPASGDYNSNLAMIRAQTVRNRNHDGSPYRLVPSADLVPSNHYGPRSEYLNNPGSNPEQSFPVQNGGQFRAGCEFSHFSYDDPLVFPGQPGAAHLHMYFGNTDVNAYSTADSVLNTGSSTCNGQELNRTAYWAPAMFDGQGNVRIPERIVVYYKGEGLARGAAEPFPEGAAMIASQNLNTVDSARGGAVGKFNFVCSENYSGEAAPLSNTMPACDGNRFLDLYGVRDEPHVVLEMNVKFPQCWNGQDPSNIDNFRAPSNGSWYYSNCDGEFGHTLVNLEYFINYRVELGENTRDWYLSSDVDPMSEKLAGPGGHSIHADWWGGWHAETNKQFIDNCVNYKSSTSSGCGFGYLTDGGPDGNNPYDGPALKYRDQYTGPSKVPASELYSELCPGSGNLASTTAAAYCKPGSHHHGGT